MSAIAVSTIAESHIAVKPIAQRSIAVYIVAGTASQRTACQTRHTTLTEPIDKAIEQAQRTPLAEFQAICLDKAF